MVDNQDWVGTIMNDQKEVEFEPSFTERVRTSAYSIASRSSSPVSWSLYWFIQYSELEPEIFGTLVEPLNLMIVIQKHCLMQIELLLNCLSTCLVDMSEVDAYGHTAGVIGNRLSQLGGTGIMLNSLHLPVNGSVGDWLTHDWVVLINTQTSSCWSVWHLVFDSDAGCLWHWQSVRNLL